MSDVHRENQKGHGMQDFLVPLAILVAWFVLNAWILPRFGIST
jgi:hypothetical protein